jgi:hypothetical protein
MPDPRSPFSFGASASPQPGFSFGMAQPHSQVKSRQVEYKRPELHGSNSPDPWQMILQLLSQQQPAQQNFVPENLAALRNDPQGDRNRAYMPGVMNDANPFANGFFKNPAERTQIERDRLTVDPENPVFGMTGVQGGLAAPQLPPPFAPPMQAPLSGMMPQRPAANPFAMMDSGGLTGPKTPGQDAGAAAAYRRQAKPGGLMKYRRPV